MVSRLRRHAVVVAACLVTIAMLGPALGGGYVLTYDMVFVPRQSLLPASVGLGDVLPRAVPQDAVLAALTAIAPGAVWQHLMLVGVISGSFLGVARLLRRSATWQQIMGGLLYAWSAFMAERLVLGSWPLLVAYAVLPWALGQALAARSGRSGAASRVVLLIALASLAPYGGLLVLAVALPVAIGPGSRLGVAGRWATALGAVAVQLPWVVPSVISPARGVADPAGFTIFALRPEGPWGPLVTALGTGGVWSAEVVPASRAAGLGLVGTTVVVVLSALGVRALAEVVGRAGLWTLVGLSLAGLVAAVVGSVAPQAVAALGQAPGVGLLRDGQRALVPLALLFAIAAPIGAARVVRRLADPTARRVVVGALVVLPILVMPDAAWGQAGRLAAVDYPQEWWQVRQAMQQRPEPGDVVVLPWGTFRAFAWNNRRTVLDPAPRWLPRPAVVDDTLRVRMAGGDVVQVAGESPRGAAVAAALAANSALLPTMEQIGAGFVLVESGTPGDIPSRALDGLRPVLRAGALDLYAAPGGAPAPAPPPASVVAVIAAWVLAGIALVVSLGKSHFGVRRFASRNAGGGGSVRTLGSEEGT